jgi:hypothetical protein
MKAMNSLIRRRSMPAICAIITLTVVSGCTNNSGGNALPVTSAASSTAPPSNAASVDPFDGLKACAVLDKALEGRGFSPAVVDTSGGDNGCKADKAQYGGLNLTLQPDLGINDINGDKSQQHDGYVLGRPSIQVREGLGSSGDCAIAMEVTNTSRAFVVASLSTGTTDEACTFVESVADKVEPQLPKGN